jgi:hypothetical protein
MQLQSSSNRSLIRFVRFSSFIVATTLGDVSSRSENPSPSVNDENWLTYLGARGTEPVVIREMPSLEAALEYAGQLVSDNYANVAIHDGKGNQVSGDDLLAYYLGVVKLMPDLRAVKVQDAPSKK